MIIYYIYSPSSKGCRILHDLLDCRTLFHLRDVNSSINFSITVDYNKVQQTNNYYVNCELN